MRIIFISFLLIFCKYCKAQDDLLVLKKNGHTVKVFYPASEMDFSTATRYYEGIITGIKNDSVFLVQYDIRSGYSPSLGVIVPDTVAAYHFGVNYNEIISFGKPRKNFDWRASGAALFGGGAILTTAGLLSWVFAKPNTRYYASSKLVIGSAALTVIGYLLLKSGKKTMILGKKYTLKYINLN